MKSFLFVLQTAAYAGNKTQEVLDVVLIAAAFEQKVSLLLLDDAVFHLKNNQQAELINSKKISAIFRSLKLYDIEHIYVEQDSMLQRGLLSEDFLIPVILLARTEIATTLKAFDFVLNG